MEKSKRSKNKKRRTERRSSERAPAKDNSKRIVLWMEKSVNFVSTLPTITEIREELADWHSFEPLDPREFSMA
jgi:hypothetical protein